MWSLSSVRSRLSSSSLASINGGFKCLSFVPSGFSTGPGEKDNEMEKNPNLQDNSMRLPANMSSRDILQGRLDSMHVAGEGDKAMEWNSNPQDNFRGPMANLNSQHNFRGPMANTNSQDNFRGPTANMNFQGNFRGPITNMNSQDTFGGPMANMNSQDYFRERLANMNSQDNFRRPTPNAGTHNILRETMESIRFSAPRDFNYRRNSRPMDFVKGVLEQDEYIIERDAHFVLIQLKRNNTHINVTDAKGDTKFWTASGNKNVGGGGKVTRYAAEATAEYVGRRVREMGLKSVVMRVKGFTHFKKKRQAIMSFKEGYSSSRSDRNPIVYLEDVTRKPHNGCRLPKKRRI